MSFYEVFLAISKCVNRMGGRPVACIEGIIHEGFDEMILWEDGGVKLRSACEFV